MAHDFCPSCHTPDMPKGKLAPDVRKKLEAAAAKVMKNAHAPYSKFHVGSAVLLTNGKIYTGCNVENASYGMTICAERTAVVTAVAAGVRRFRRLVLTTDAAEPVSPCGACRQVLAEFGEPSMPIVYAAEHGLTETTLGALLPAAFDAATLRGAAPGAR